MVPDMVIYSLTRWIYYTNHSLSSYDTIVEGGSQIFYAGPTDSALLLQTQLTHMRIV